MKSCSLLSNQIMELKLQHEQERTHLLQQHNTEKDSLVQDHQREIASLEKRARSAMAQHQAQTQEWRKRDGQVCGLFFSVCGLLLTMPFFLLPSLNFSSELLAKYSLYLLKMVYMFL